MKKFISAKLLQQMLEFISFHNFRKSHDILKFKMPKLPISYSCLPYITMIQIIENYDNTSHVINETEYVYTENPIILNTSRQGSVAR